MNLNAKYPHITVALTEIDGNIFCIIGAVSKALRKADVSPDEISEFRADAMSGDYNNALRACMRWVNVS